MIFLLMKVYFHIFFFNCFITVWNCLKLKKKKILCVSSLSSLFSGPQQHHSHRLWLQEGIYLLGGLNQAKWSKDQQNASQWEWPQGTAGFSYCDCMPYGALCHFTQDSLALLCMLPIQLLFMNLSLLYPAVFLFIIHLNYHTFCIVKMHNVLEFGIPSTVCCLSGSLSLFSRWWVHFILLCSKRNGFFFFCLQTTAC